MANILVESKRKNYGEALQNLIEQGSKAVDQMERVHAEMQALKSKVEADSDFTIEDAAVIQSSIDTVIDAIKQAMFKAGYLDEPCL